MCSSAFSAGSDRVSVSFSSRRPPLRPHAFPGSSVLSPETHRLRVFAWVISIVWQEKNKNNLPTHNPSWARPTTRSAVVRVPDQRVWPRSAPPVRSSRNPRCLVCRRGLFRSVRTRVVAALDTWSPRRGVPKTSAPRRGSTDIRTGRPRAWKTPTQRCLWTKYVSTPISGNSSLLWVWRGAQWNKSVSR